MSKLTMYEIEAELIEDEDMDAWLRLTHDDHGEVMGVVMSLPQLAIISDRFLPKRPQQIQQTQSDAHAFVMEEHARLLDLLGDEIAELRDDKLGYFGEIMKCCGSGHEIALKIRSIADLAYSLERHLAVLMPSGVKTDAVPPAPTIAETERGGDVKPPAVESDVNSVTEIINVTSKPTNRGRPKTDRALSGAERTAAYRARKSESQDTLFQTSGG